MNYIGLSNSNETQSNLESKGIFDFNIIGENFKNLILEYIQINVSNLNLIYLIIFLLLAVSSLGILFTYLANLLNAYTRFKALSAVRSDIFNLLLEKNLTFFNTNKSGNLISRLTNDTLAFVQGLISVPHHLFQTSIIIIFYSFYLISTDVQLTFYIFLVFILNQALTFLLKNPVKNREIEVLDKTSIVTSRLQETFSNIKLVKTFAKEFLSNKILSKIFLSTSNSFYKASKFQVLEPSLRNLLNVLAEVFIVFICVLKLFNGTITLEGFILYMYISRLLLQPIADFSAEILWIQRIRASFNSLKEYIDNKQKDKEGSIIINEFSNNIKFENVFFKYSKNSTLENINFSIEKGKSTAIVGPSGAGKSTIIDLILRLYDPNAGDIYIDKYNLKELKISDYKKIFGVVNQESFLFNDTIENNIRFGNLNLSMSKITEACKKANADEFIQKLPNKYKTIIGDRGLKLSGGQKQRLSIARAIVNDPQIIILDEATSSLDNHSENLVIDAIKNIIKTKTTIIVAHRLTSFIHADNIFLINKGQIVDSGSHSKLSKYNKLYQKLYTN